MGIQRFLCSGILFPVAEVGYTAYVSVGYYYIFYVTECVRGYYCAGAF